MKVVFLILCFVINTTIVLGHAPRESGTQVINDDKSVSLARTTQSKNNLHPLTNSVPQTVLPLMSKPLLPRYSTVVLPSNGTNHAGEGNNETCDSSRFVSIVYAYSANASILGRTLSVDEPSAEPSPEPSRGPASSPTSSPTTGAPTAPPIVINPRSVEEYAEAFGGFRVIGYKESHIGSSMRFIGDYNNDGLQDIAFSAPYYFYNGQYYIGMVLIVLGDSSGRVDIDLFTATSGPTMRRCIGVNPMQLELAGNTVAPAGDVNNDGFGDVLIAVPHAGPFGRSHAGTVFVIFGMESTFGYTDIFLDSTVTTDTNGFRVFGPVMWSQLGYRGALFRALGDINGDAIDDFAVSATYDPVNTNSPGGTVWFIYGTTDAATDLDLATLSSSAGVQMGESEQHDQFGCAMDNVGDFNGDGLADFLIGAYLFDAPGTTDSGAAFLIYGNVLLPNIKIDTFVTGVLGIRFLGTASGDEAGKTVSGAGDINGDGKMDLLIGAPGSDHPDGRSNTGVVYVIFGTSKLFTEDFMLSTQMASAAGFAVVGPDSAYLLGTTVSRAGDLDQDGIDDYMVGAGWTMYVLYGSTVTPSAPVDLRSFTGRLVAFAQPSDGPITSIVGGSDVTDDGIADLVVGFEFLNYQAGVAYMLPGPIVPDTAAPSEGPTVSPTQEPSASPTAAPSSDPSAVPSAVPTTGPSVEPSLAPSAAATEVPTLAPSGAPSPSPSHNPSAAPSSVPIVSVPSPAPSTSVPSTGSPTPPPVVIIPRSIQTFTNSSAGLRVIGVGTSATGSTVSMIGDYNGDGLQDFAVSAIQFNYTGRVNCGLVVIVLGTTSKWVDIDIATATSGLLLRRIIGEHANDYIGTTVAPAGDVNNDGFADVLIGSAYFSTPQNGTAPREEGAVYVIFGMASTFGYTDIDLGSFITSATTGFMIIGADYSESFGFEGAVLRALGDINGDSIDDIAVSSPHCTYAFYRAAAGCVYFIYGKTTAPSNIYFNNVGDAGTLMGGAEYSDFFGSAMDNVGDFNGDGKSDFLIGAPGYSSPGRDRIGAAYLIFGAATSADMDMASFVTGEGGIRFLGVAKYDMTGHTVSGAGDINGDGKMDLLIGAPYAEVLDGRINAGIVYVIFGTSIVFTADVELGSLAAGVEGFAVIGTGSPQLLGNSISRAGDLNQDGIDDFIVGTATSFYVFYGSVKVTTTHVDLLSFTGNIVAFQSTFDNEFGYFDLTVTSGIDVDSDGIPDLLVGLPNTRDRAGVAFLMRGPVLFDTTAPSEGPTVSPTQEPSASPTAAPSSDPSAAPSAAPSAGPSVEPSLHPSAALTEVPTLAPSGAPSPSPSHNPSVAPSSMPIVSVPSPAPSTSVPSTGSPTPPPVIIIPKSIQEYSVTSGGFRVIGADGSRVGFAVCMIGDYNGDGLQDFAISANQYTYNDRTLCGLVLIVLGRSSAWTELDLSTATSDQTMRRVIGGASNQEIGSTVAPAGDVNADGFADVLIGAPFFQPLGRYAAGAVFVIFGVASTSSYTDIDLASFSASPTTGFVIYGTELWSRLGSGGAVLRALGDINADSIDDFAVAAPFVSYSSRPTAGVVWLIYGTAAAPANIDLLSLAPEAGIKIGGAFDDDQFGTAVDNVGDFNGDGIADFLIGAYQFDAPGTTNSGAAYLIYGTTARVDIDMRLFVTGVYGICFLGAASGDEAGKAVSGAGDINGDGKMDLLIGAPRSDHSDGRVDSGAVYVIFGTSVVFASDFYLSTLLAGARGHAIFGLQSYQGLGFIISRAGDLDQDGIDDYLVGSGEAIYALFGSTNAPTTHLDLHSFAGKMVAFAAPSEAMVSMTAGVDFDADGIPDILVGIPFSDLSSVGLTRSFAGLVYMMRGPIIPNSVAPSARPTASSTDVPTFAPIDAPTPLPSQEPTPGAPTTVAPSPPPVVIVPQSIQTFTNTSGGLNIIGASGSSTGSTVNMIGDYNNDGLLDLYVGRYLDPREAIPTTFYARNGLPNQLYKNNGNGTFTNVTVESGVGELGLCLGSVFGDYDDDGYADLYVVNDFGRKTLYHNNRNGTFTDVTVKSGTLAYGAGMSASMADYDNDGRLDIYCTNIRSEEAWFASPPTVARYMVNCWRQGVWMTDMPLYWEVFKQSGTDFVAVFQQMASGNTLLRNKGDGTFEDTTVKASANPVGWYWGASFADFDNDGWQDIYAADGWVFHAGPSAAMHWIDTRGVGAIVQAGLRSDDPYAMTASAT